MKWYQLLCMLVASLLTPTASVQAVGVPFQVAAESVLVLDAKTNQVILDKNATDVRSIASITKLMTAMVTLDIRLPMDELITITQAEVHSTMLHGRRSGASLPVGTTMTRGDVLHLTLMNSQNRAAAALGRTYPGGMHAFITAMNTKAMQLGMVNSTFVDTTGLSPNNVSTAQDLVLMVKAASGYPMIQELSTSTQLATLVRRKPHEFGTTNRLLKTPDWNILLQKTGYTTPAGMCLVMVTTVSDNPFIVVILNAPGSKQRAGVAIAIKHWIETGDAISTSHRAKLNPYTTYSKKKRHTVKHKKAPRR